MAKINKEIGYPTTSVIFIYAFGGGAVGGFFIGLLWGIELFLQELSTISIVELIIIPFSAMFFGFFLGLIPALLTGIILAKKQFMIKEKMDYLEIAFFGFLISIIYVFPSLSSSDTFLSLFSVGLIGAISAVIVGKWVLPKEDKMPKEI